MSNSGKGRATWTLILALLVAGSANADDTTPVPPNFDKPQELFGATLAERFSNLSVEASSLYHLLEAGDLILVNYRPGSSSVPWLTTSGTIVNAPPETVYQVIADVAHYHEFMPQTASASATPVVPGIDRVDLVLRIHVLLTSITNAYSLYYYYQPPHRIDWTLAKGEFEANIGAFELVEVAGQPGRTMLLHTSYALPRNRLLGSLFSRVPDLDLMVNLTTGTMMMEAVKKRAETVYEKAGGSVTPVAVPADIPAHLARLAGTLDRLARRGPVTLVEHASPRFYTGVSRVSRDRADLFDAIVHLDRTTAAVPFYTAKVLEIGDTAARYEVESTIPLMIDFDAEYTLAATFAPPDRIGWAAEPGGDLEGLEASWRLVERPGPVTLLVYRSRSDLASLGFTMRKLLDVEPLFEHGIHISEIRRMMSGVKRWTEATPEARAKLEDE